MAEAETHAGPISISSLLGYPMRSISKPVLELTLYSAAQYFGIAVGFYAALKVEDGTWQGIVSA